MQRLKFDKLFFKFLVSYFLVLLIPVSLINGVFGARFIGTYKKEIQAQAQVDLVHLGDLLDGEMQNLSITVDQMRLFMDFAGYHFEDNPLAARKYRNDLSVYTTTNPFISGMVLYLRGEDYIITDQTTCQLDLFLNQIYRFEHLDSRQLRELLVDGDSRVVLPNQWIATPGNRQEYITVLEPLYTDYQTVLGTCMFFIEANTVRGRGDAQLGQYGAVFEIRDQGGRLIYSEKPDKPGEPGDSGEGYFAAVHESPVSGWTYTAYVPQNQKFLVKIDRLNRELLMFTVGALIMASLLISVLMRMNYSPIRRLGEKASSLLSDRDQKGGFETIATTLDYLSDRNRYLAMELQNSASAIKNNRLQRLLTGHYMSREDFNLDVQDLDMGYQHEWFFVAVVQIHGTVTDYDAFARFVQERLSGHWESCYTFTPEPDRMILINAMAKEAAGSVEQVLEQMGAAVKAAYHLDVTTGVGKLYEGTLSVPRSYLEARSALDYRFVKGNGSTILYRKLPAGEHAALPYPKQQFEQLRDAVGRGDQERIHGVAEVLIEYIQKKNLPLFVAKGICFDILSLFIEASASVHYTLPDAAGMSRLNHLDTVDDVICLIQELNTELVPQTTDQPQPDGDALLEEIIGYIRQNCLRCEFSIQETAEHFHMLLPNLSQFFKDKTGRNVLDYSAKFRMDTAKSLLLDDKLTLKEVGQQVGYYNVSSFIRRFKQLNAMTPGDYRKLNGKD